MVAKPNILILMPDQQRADCMSYAGHTQLKTPNMDRIAREGMRFAQAATASPICMSARASFLTSLYPHNHGMWENSGTVPATYETFFHVLQRAGYFTAGIGKFHNYPQEPGLHMRDREDYMHALGLDYVNEIGGPHATAYTASHMTDEWDKKGLWEVYKQDYRERDAAGDAMVRPSPLSVEDFADTYVGRKATEFVESYEDSRPLCLFVGFGGPHEPWDAPGEYATMYDPKDTPPPISIPDAKSSLPDHVRAKKDFEVWPQAVQDSISKIRGNYYGKISLVDRWFGHIMDAFQNRGWLDDLLIVHWSDHGEMAGDHGRFHKMTFHESSLRVPLTLRWPGQIPENATTAALAENIDIFPTLLEAVGCEPSKQCLGLSLWPVFRNPELDLREYQLSEIRYGGERHIMIRSHRHKYAVDEEDRSFMLYDFQDDPMEQDNLVGEKGRTALEQHMREELLKRLIFSQYSM